MEQHGVSKREKQDKGEGLVNVKVSIPKELHRRIKVISVLTGTPMSQVVARGLQEWVDKQDVKSLL